MRATNYWWLWGAWFIGHALSGLQHPWISVLAYLALVFAWMAFTEKVEY